MKSFTLRKFFISYDLEPLPSMTLQVCTVFNAGELSLVEYGVNKVLGMVRINPHLIKLVLLLLLLLFTV